MSIGIILLEQVANTNQDSRDRHKGLLKLPGVVMMPPSGYFGYFYRTLPLLFKNPSGEYPSKFHKLPRKVFYFIFKTHRGEI